MATIPVYLTDDDGNEIEQTAGSGDFIIIGYVDQDLFANASGELYTTFFDVVQAATPEQKAEVLRGLRLAKGIRGDLRRFELSGTSENAYVKYNHSIFGGRYQSQYTALGAIAGTYLRRGGSAFTKELVEAALVSGPFASFSNFPSSPVLPGDVTFQVNAGGGTVEGYAWTITDGTTTFSPTVASPTVTLTEATWTVSVDVTIDGTVVSVAGQTLEVSALAVAAGLTNSNPTPNLGESTLLGLIIDDPDMPLLLDIEWSFNVELAAGQRVELTEDVDYTINAKSGKTIDVTFLTAGTFEVSATVTDTSGTVVSTQTNLDVANYATTNTVTSHSIMSQATADALVQGDTHLIVLGDSMMNPLKGEWLRNGLVQSWKPARWAGIQPAGNATTASAGDTANDKHDGHRWILPVNADRNRTNGGSGNARHDGTNGSGTQLMDARLGARRTMPGTYTELTSTGATTWNIDVVARQGANEGILRGRLQGDNDQFYRSSSVNSRVLLYNLDGTPTVRASADDASGADSVITLDTDSYSLVEVERDATQETDAIYSAFDLSFDSIDNGDRFGIMDSFIYSPAISGLSVSYLGDGGWNTSNHTSDAARVAANAGQKNQYYIDEACVAHLNMVAWKDKAQTTLRDNIFILLEIQNIAQAAPAGHDGQMREDLLAILTRWNNAADVVDPTGALKAQLKLIVVALADGPNSNQHDRVADMMPDLAGLGGYAQVEFIDLYNAIKADSGGIYANPLDYTAAGTGSGTGVIQPPWYSVDTIHPTEEGGLQQMRIFWDVVKDAASDPTGFSFTINAPSNGTTGDTYNYTLSGSLPTDRLVTWYVDDVETAYGDSFTLPAVVGTFVVKATVNGLDGASTTVTAPAVTISAPNVPPVVASPLALQTGADTTEGQQFNIVVTATDGNGDDLTYSLSSTESDIGSTTLASGVEAVIPVLAGLAGATATYTVTITDGNGGSVVETLDVTFLSANALPAFSSGLALDGPNPTEGNPFTMNFTVFDSDPGDTLTVTLTSTAGDNISKVATSGVSNFFRPTAQSGTVTYTATVDDGNGGTDVSTLDVTADPPNTAPTSSSSVTVVNASEVGDTAAVSITNITDDSTPVSSLTYVAQFSVDGGAFSNVSGDATGNVLDAAGNGVVSVSHACSIAGDYVFRITVTDGNGDSTNFDSSAVTITSNAPTLIASESLTGSSGNNYTASTNNSTVTAAAGIGAGSLNTVIISGGTNGIRRSMGSSANASAYASWVNSSVSMIRWTNSNGDVVEYDTSIGTLNTAGAFVNTPGVAYSINGGANQNWNGSAQSLFAGSPPLTIEYFG